MNDLIFQKFFNELKTFLLSTTYFSTWSGYARQPLTLSTNNVPFFYTMLGIEDNIDVLDINGTHTTDEENTLQFSIKFGVHNPDKRDTDLQQLADKEDEALENFRTELYNYLKDTNQTYSSYFGSMKLGVIPTAFTNGQKYYETYTINITAIYKHTMCTGA